MRMGKGDGGVLVAIMLNSSFGVACVGVNGVVL